MAPKNVILAALAALILSAVCLQAQTRSLIYNATNGRVIANTGTNGLTFTNQVAFLASDITTYGSGLTSFGVSLNFEERRVQDVAITNDVFNWSSGEYVELGLPIAFVSTNKAATTRTNLGLGLPALTNTSNATMMRALSGSTNTNHPFSGTVDIIDGNMDSHNVTISNGIIVNWQAP